MLVSVAVVGVVRMAVIMIVAMIVVVAAAAAAFVMMMLLGIDEGGRETPLEGDGEFAVRLVPCGRVDQHPFG